MGYLASWASMFGFSGMFLVWLIVIMIWKLAWYGIALFDALKQEKKVWFVVLFTAAFVLNDLGILAIVYLILNKKIEKPKKRTKRK